MTLEYDDDAPEPRDYTKFWWAGFIVLFLALVGVLYLYSGFNPQTSVVRARHILVTFDAKDPGERGRALEKIRQIRERVLKGEDFGKLAEDYSNDPGSASKGGDLGYVKKGELAEEIDNYVWSAPVGQLSDILTTKFGFHIVVVDDRRLSDVDALRIKEDQEWKKRLQSGETAPRATPETPDDAKQTVPEPVTQAPAPAPDAAPAPAPAPTTEPAPAAAAPATESAPAAPAAAPQQ